MVRRRGLEIPIPEVVEARTPAGPRRDGVTPDVPVSAEGGWRLEGEAGAWALPRERVVLGRQTQPLEADIGVAHASLSRRHVELVPLPDGWMVRDLGSTNGSWLDGQPLAPGAALAFGEGQTLRVGELELALRRGGI